MPQNILLYDKPEVRECSFFLVPPREIIVPKRNKSIIHRSITVMHMFQ